MTAGVITEFPHPDRRPRAKRDHDRIGRQLRLILSRPIDWDLLGRQYDEMVKYATALRTGTAQTEDILAASPEPMCSIPPTGLCRSWVRLASRCFYAGISD